MKKPYFRSELSGKRIPESILLKIVDDHRQWLNSDKKEGRCAVFEGLNFHGFSPTKLNGKPIGGVMMKGVVLDGGRISACNFSGAYFQGGTLNNATLVDSHFVRARLKGAKLNGAKLTSCRFDHAYIRNSTNDYSEISGCEFHGVIGDQSRFNNSTISNCEFEFSYLSKSKFCKALIDNSIFSNSRMKNSDLSKVDIKNSTFVKVDLSNSSLKGSYLKYSDFEGAIFSGASFESARVLKVNLKGANFTGATLINTTFESVDLTDAVFSNVIIDLYTRNNLPEWLLQKYGDTFRLLPETNGVRRIKKSIYFEPEHRQAGVGVLSYFSTVLETTYPDSDIRFSIEQNGELVSLIIETPEGDLIERIEKTLNEYGGVISGKIPVNSFTSDEVMMLDIKTELRIAQMRIETQSELLAYKDREIERLFDSITRSLDKESGNVNLIGNNITNKGFKSMRDKYVVEQAGAVGARASVDKVVFHNHNSGGTDSIDLSVLCEELALLRKEMRLISNTAEEDAELGSIAAAEKAAQTGDGNAVVDNLKNLGNWSLDVSTKLGVNTASAAIKSALGL